MADEHPENLSPPKRTGTADPGAHELAESSDSEDHFSDAQSGPSGDEEATLAAAAVAAGEMAGLAAPSSATSSHRNSPIPRTRVEKVTQEPSYGEVPGTEAWVKRAEDAEPDEIAIVPDERERARLAAEEAERAKRPSPPVPITVVEETPDADGSVTHQPTPKQLAHHRADAPPDLVLRPAEGAEGAKTDGDGEGAKPKGAINKADADGGIPDTPISPALKSPSVRSRRKSSQVNQNPLLSPLSPTAPRRSGGDDEGFGDDFDDFEEGGGEDDDDDDFGDFDDGDFEEPEPEPEPVAAPAQPRPAPPPAPSLPFPVPDLDGLETSDLPPLLTPYLDLLYPPSSLSSASESFPPPLTRAKADNPVFLTPRSASLWQQLVAPPPLQPPDWIRSRIRRLFLVSLGVPVDLDEILDPRKKQKKLVLPSSLQRVNSGRRTPGGGSARNSTDSQRGRSVGRLKHEGSGLSNLSSTSLDSGGGGASTPRRTGSKRRVATGPADASSSAARPGSSSSAATVGAGTRKGPPPEPELDLVWARRLCGTTDAALGGMTEGELEGHVEVLRRVEKAANEALEYWRRRADEQISEREAFEGVIENLVKHARKVRK